MTRWTQETNRPAAGKVDQPAETQATEVDKDRTERGAAASPKTGEKQR